MISDPRYLMMHLAIFLIAIGLISTLIIELRKPPTDPNSDEDTKRLNDILKD